MAKTYRVRKQNKFNYWAIHFNYSRRLWGAKDDERKKCLEKARSRVGTTFRWRCSQCLQFFLYFQVQVDHINPIANSMPQTREEFLECFDRLYVPADKLQVMCLDCHHEKTRLEIAERKQK